MGTKVVANSERKERWLCLQEEKGVLNLLLQARLGQHTYVTDRHRN
jgi:hypothetical protein